MVSKAGWREDEVSEEQGFLSATQLTILKDLVSDEIAEREIDSRVGDSERIHLWRVTCG